MKSCSSLFSKQHRKQSLISSTKVVIQQYLTFVFTMWGFFNDTCVKCYQFLKCVSWGHSVVISDHKQVYLLNLCKRLWQKQKQQQKNRHTLICGVHICLHVCLLVRVTLHLEIGCQVQTSGEMWVESPFHWKDPAELQASGRSASWAPSFGGFPSIPC